MKTVAIKTNAQDAHLLRIRLEGAGIPAIVPDDATLSVAPYLANAIGGIRVQVADDDFERASALLESENEQSEDVDLREGLVCPHCGSTNIARDLDEKRSYFFSFLILILLLLPVPFIKRRYRCNDCNHLWK